MVRIFSLLAAIAALLILVTGIGVQWLSQSDIAAAKQNAAKSLADGVAVSLSGQLDMFHRTLYKIAEDPDVLAAFSSKDSERLSAVAARLEKNFPDILRIRLLLPGVNTIDKNSAPPMGFADLDMVKESFSRPQNPGINGDEGPDRHLAMTQRVVRNDQVVGVILASLKYDFIGNALKEIKVANNYAELKQGKLVLGATGGEIDKTRLKAGQITVPNTDWQLHYWYPEGIGLMSASFITSMIIVPLLLVLLAVFAGYRRLSLLLSQDLSAIMKAFKDLTNNRPQTNYPINLAEMNAVIPTLVQFKRVASSSEIIVSEPEEFELNDFFSESSTEPVEKILDSNELKLSAEIVQPDTPAPEMSASIGPAVSNVEVKKTRVDSIFKAYDIRGIVNKTLTEQVVQDIGRAIGTLASENGCKTVVVAQDGRTSSPALSQSLINGIVSAGCNVMDIGMVPTPVLYFVAQHIDGRSGVMVTGSHNPGNYNGLKIVLNGETLSGEKIQAIKQLVEDKAFISAESGQVEQNHLFVEEYLGMIGDDIRPDRKLKVVVDCGNGVTGKLGPQLLKNLGCEVVELFTEIDGNFPNHHPDPGKPENMEDLISAVKIYQADLGVAFDGDGDRLGVVDNQGKIIWPDRQMMLFAKDVLAAKPGAEVIYDVKCSRHLGAQIAKFGGRGTMWKTGHSLLKAKLKETGAKLAGEMSGHIFFNDRWFGFDDALYACARLIEIIARDERSSAEIFADFPDSINTPELTVLMSEGENFAFIDALSAEVNFAQAKIITIDGLRAEFADGWGLVRASNTMPSLVVRFEADTQEALKAIQEAFREAMLKIKPDLTLPF